MVSAISNRNNTEFFSASQVISVTLSVAVTFCQGHCMSFHLQGLPKDYLLGKMYDYTVHSARELPCQNLQTKTSFFTFSVNIITLNFGQGHFLAYHLKGHLTDYLLTKFHCAHVISDRDMVKNVKKMTLF